MALALKQLTGGSGYFSPKDHKEDVAILIEVKRFEHQRPGGTYGPKDTIHADVTYFATQADLDAGKPSLVGKNTMIQGTVLVRDLNDEVGEGNATVVTIAQSKPKPGQQPAWVLRTVPASVTEKVVAYADKRDTALAEAVAAAPSFD